MKQCQHCQTQLDDGAVFCATCGARVGQNAPENNVPPQQTAYVPPIDPYDHTNEFDAADISNNKVISMLVYLMGTLGILIALIASSSSPYVAFHVRQALKFTVVNILLGIIALILCWTVIVPIVCGIMFAVLFIIKIVCFFQICSGKAKEPAIIRDLGFLK